MGHMKKIINEKHEFVINTYVALIFRQKALFPTNLYYCIPHRTMFEHPLGPSVVKLINARCSSQILTLK